jgi:hypothetical protein
MAEVPPGGGGSAGDVTIIFQHEGDQLLGGGQLQRIVEVGCESHPSLTFFQFRLNQLGYTRQVAAAFAEGYSILIEGILAKPAVSAIAYVQDVNQAGALLDELEVYWQTPDGSAQGSIVVNMVTAVGEDVWAAVDAAMAAFA